MKKIIFTLFFVFAITTINTQVIQSRLLKVDQVNMKEFVDGVSKKTKIYNSKKGQSRYMTFRVLTGDNAQNFVRMQVADSIQEFDNVYTEGNNYWRSKVGSIHQSIGNTIWSMSKKMSYYIENKERVNHRRILFYNFNDSGAKDFWRFRERIKKAMVESKYGQNMNVLYCNSGCNGNVVQVRFHHKNFAGQSNDYGIPLKKMIEKYDELYGEDAYEQDSQKVDESLMPNGRTVRHQVLVPELSSPENMN
tara:strand:- start:7044 stop:7790 length:747 start_codon:yes stop_codon:yes gene_type:complete